MTYRTFDLAGEFERDVAEVRAVVARLASMGIEALYGGCKGDGFWLCWQEPSGSWDRDSIEAPDSATGNPWFWSWDAVFRAFLIVG